MEQIFVNLVRIASVLASNYNFFNDILFFRLVFYSFITDSTVYDLRAGKRMC